MERIQEYINGLKEPKQRPDLILVNSPINDYNRIPRPETEILPAFGLAYIATVCEDAGFNVGVIDAETQALTPEKTARLINEANPRWIGVNMLTPTYELTRRIVNNTSPSISVMAGAAHAKALPEMVLRDPLIGRRIVALALEDGEFIAKGLLEGIDPSEMGGVAYTNSSDEIVIKKYDTSNLWIPKNLDTLPFADRKFLPSDPFESQGRVETNMVGSRGCPFNCNFCAGAREMLLFGIRNRSQNNIITEQQMLREQGISAVRFIDDLFLANKRRMREYFTETIETGLAQDFVWDATGRVNTLAKLDTDMLELMSRSGCREVSIGVESGSQRVLDLMDKGVTPEMVKESVKKLTSVGIRVKGYFILGTPTESLKEMESTVSFMHQLRRLARETVSKNPITPTGQQNEGQFRGSMFEFRPYPGTPIYEYIVGNRPWPKGIWKDNEIPIHYPESLVINSFRPVFMEDLEVRQKHNYTTDLAFARGVFPYQVQELIAEAMKVQRDDMIKHGEYLPGLRSIQNREVESR